VRNDNLGCTINSCRLETTKPQTLLKLEGHVYLVQFMVYIVLK